MADGHERRIKGMTASASLKVSGISRSYDRFEALHELSFELGPGEVLGLLGPNGAGKTTAIRVLTTIYPPSRGGFTLDGIPHTRPAEIRRRIGVLPESTGYPLQLTGQEYLVLFGRLFGRPRADAKAKAVELLAVVGLEERASSRIGTYSRGMRQRLGMARALVNDPEVLFLDEPTLGFDPRGQREVLDIIRDIALERGSSVVISTHFLESVEHVCSRVIILSRGRVVADGSVASIKRKVDIPRTGRVRVPPEMHDAAMALLRGTPAVGDVRPEGAGRGDILVTLHEGGTGPGRGNDGEPNAAISALVGARIPILSFSLESANLSDAFLEITKEAER
jgi:ABC-2 type transport system ATP-binding protein